MGFWHSITSSVTNYFYPQQAGGHPTEANIRTKAQKLILYCKQAQYRLQQATIKEEDDLVKALQGNQKIRTKAAEQIRMQAIIRSSEKMLVYDELIIQLNKIINEARMIEMSPQLVSNECIIAINSVLFLYDKLQLHQYVTVNEMLPQPTPVVGIEKTSLIIQKYLNQKKISQYQLNLYACELGKRHKVPLQLFNALGHQFVPDPQEPFEESPSARMFALTIEDVELPEYGQTEKEQKEEHNPGKKVQMKS